MFLHFLPLLLALLFAVAAHAFDETKHLHCLSEAYFYCHGNVPNPETAPWNIAYYQCMSAFWKTVPSDGKAITERLSPFLPVSDQCPHPNVGCSCYRGCVDDRWSIFKDVGGWCTNACRLGRQAPLPCSGT
ncbi:hypothetical protein V8E36_006887 [Tilletia maclaganii]